ncbi:MAG TPA: tetratricopeptide repeat protein [bacterium]|nr:tetratricopeptide repeat protein [bacterium]
MKRFLIIKQSKSIIIRAIACLLLLASNVIADHNQYLFNQASERYQQDKYDEAIAVYQEILNNGYESWQLYYNLGNCYYRIGKLGKALVNYERAYRLNPKNEDVEFNLRLANTRTVDNIVTPPLYKTIQQIKYFIDIKSLAWIVLSLYFVVVLLIIVKILWRNIRAQKWLMGFVIPLAIVFVLFAALLTVRIHEQKTVEYAILLAQKVEVLGAPTDEGTVLFILHEGVKFRVEDISGQWAKIRLADGNVGWIKQDVFEII